MIDNLRAEVANLRDQSDVTPQIDVVNAELRRIQEKAKMEGEKADLRREKDNLNGECRLLKNRLRSLDDMMKIKEEKLRGRSKDTYAAVKWLRQNKHLFSGNVYEPMMLVVRAYYLSWPCPNTLKYHCRC
uniref:Uncharacterized protein n=1 Tax=Hucho hucho TaxID=62062 RepID=A0A4W5NWP5_9TELE